ncbi:right-handed parallel beta-helix repeat-containing protein [Neotamlana nanhaiensis]|uniref:right-handed parallel beta-helix repeat-containing protein n=1 Tax=Neotamlana nanhaiensis TaxID=1382798 RepID=UPI00069BF9D4|nr:right-handed parallel beta-helix repeat-containing protein [Tamlana nanhaiensis]
MKTALYNLYYKTLIAILAGVVFVGCSDDDTMKTMYTTTPGAANLTLPLNNEECEIGEIIDDKATVTFNWDAANATENYNLTITNLTTQNQTLNVGLETNSTVVTLTRGYAYSWTVTSRNSGDTTTDSETWKFYLAGDAESNNVPFPATLLKPLSGTTIAPLDGKITFEWEGGDPDGDDVTYTLFVDTVDGKQEPLEEWKNLTETSLTVDVLDDTIYYWHVETTDGVNTSISQTYTFETGTPDGIIVSTSEEIISAINSAAAGDIIHVRGGEYTFASTIEINTSGLNGTPITLQAYTADGIRPTFNFSSMSEDSSNRGIQLNGANWHIKGIDVLGAEDNGMFISGNGNLIEFCTFSENADSGLQIGNGGANNTILNCDSFYNADSSLENADGFACKLDAGTGNKFIGCRAWQNLDDGWDGYMRGNDNITTTYENCWAFNNGILKDGSVGAGDGNGFKTGGSDDKLLSHNAIYTNCIAAGNVYDGFDHNSNRGDITMYNCAAYSNGRNISFSSTNIANSLTIKNTVSVDSNSSDSFNATNTDITNNSWQGGLSADSSDFESLDIDLLSAPRLTDGSLPNIDFMKLVSGSHLIDAGVDVGLTYNGSAPDLGAFESN